MRFDFVLVEVALLSGFVPGYHFFGDGLADRREAGTEFTVEVCFDDYEKHHFLGLMNLGFGPCISQAEHTGLFLIVLHHLRYPHCEQAV